MLDLKAKTDRKIDMELLESKKEYKIQVVNSCGSCSSGCEGCANLKKYNDICKEIAELQEKIYPENELSRIMMAMGNFKETYSIGE